MQLGLDPLEARFERRIGRPVPGRVLLVDLLQSGDALARQRVGAVVAVLGVDREAIFLVLQLLEEFEAALAADPRRRRDIWRRPGRRELSWARVKARKLAQRRLLPGHHDAHAGVARAGGDRQRAEHQRQRCVIPVASLGAFAACGSTWPPATWPSSCAITPCSWLTLSAAVSRPDVDVDDLAARRRRR